jgi:hypothetical protein
MRMSAIGGAACADLFTSNITPAHRRFTDLQLFE